MQFPRVTQSDCSFCRNAFSARLQRNSAEEALIVLVLGVDARGDPATDRALNRETGEGWVAATTGHDYADAQQRGNPVSLLVMETSGATCPPWPCAAETARSGRRGRERSRYNCRRSCGVIP